VLGKTGLRQRKDEHGQALELALIVPSPFQGQVEVSPLSQAEYERLREAMPTRRDLLICKILRGTGLRINELLRMPLSQVYENGPDTGLYVAREKKRTPAPIFELIPLQTSLGIDLRDYIKVGMRKPADQRIFYVTARQMQRVFAAAGQRALGRRVHPHELRGLFITWNLHEGGISLESTAKMVGHADPKTTLKYYDRLTVQERYAIQRRIPV
jgi:integrase